MSLFDIKLGDQQQEGFDLIKKFLDSKEKVFSLVGYAGTGKSFMIQVICDYLRSKRLHYVLCAPTHKAKTVIERFTDEEAMTLHSLLSLYPNIEIPELDFNDLMFFTNGQFSNFPQGGVVICDESSMVNDELFNFLQEAVTKLHSKIIFVGDKAQLQPVTSRDYSKVFSAENSYELTHIFRQSEDSALADILPILRTTSIGKFKEREAEFGSIYTYTTPKDFMLKSLPLFKNATKELDLFGAKILTFTNKRAAIYNKKIKDLFFPDKEFSKGEILTGHSNFECGDYKFYNSQDYFIKKDPVKVDVSIPGFIKLPGYRMYVGYDNIVELPVTVLSKEEISDDYYNSLALHVETVRTKAVDANKRYSRDRSRLWKDYYNLVKSFASPKHLYHDNRMIMKKSFDYGYAMTTHKSQGSSLDNVFIDLKDINTCRDPQVLRQLQYVAVSRTRKDCHILQ